MEAEFTKNKNGVNIKKCCASCATHEAYDHNGPNRLCTLKNNSKKRIVKKDDCCGHWTMSDFINNIKANGAGI